MNRRELLKAAAALPLAQSALSHAAFAQSPYPSRNVTMIVPFPPGGQADLAARPVALALERILGKPVIVDNRAGGGGGSVGNAAAARAEPDGHTLLMTLSSLAVLPEADRLFDRPVAYEVSQFAPIARVLADPTLLAVPASAPWKTLQEFVDDAKKRPGQIPYGSSGPYGTLHVAMEMFAASAGIKLLHVPFRGAGPALTALLSGTVQAVASAPGTLKQQVDDGKMRVLANWGAERVKSFPDLPTFRELGYKDVEFYIWAGSVRAERAARADHDAAARSDGAGGEGAGGDQDVRDRGQPGRLSGRAGVLKIRRGRQRAAGRGGEEDRQGGVGNPLHIFLFAPTSRGRIHSAGSMPHRRAEFRVNSKSKERTSSMRNAADCPRPCCRIGGTGIVRSRVVAGISRNLGTADGLHARCLAALRRRGPGCQPDRGLFAAEHAAALQQLPRGVRNERRTAAGQSRPAQRGSQQSATWPRAATMQPQSRAAYETDRYL